MTPLPRPSIGPHSWPLLSIVSGLTLGVCLLAPLHGQILKALPDSLSTPASVSDSENVLTNDTGTTVTMLGLARQTATYEGGTGGTPPDPSTAAGGSWTVNDTEDGNLTTGSITANASPNHNGSGLDAWVVRDETNSTGQFVQHTRTLSSGELTDANTYGWSMEATVRMIDDYNDGTSCMLQYGNGSRRFLIFFDLDGSDDLTANLFGTGGGVITLTSGGTGADDFHDYRLLYDPVTQTASFLVDGVRVDGGSWTGQSNGFSGVQWGTGSSGGQGTAAYHRVEHQVFSPSLALPSGAIASHVLGDVSFNPNGGYGPLTAVQTALEPVRYVITDGTGAHDTGILTVTVQGENDDPTTVLDELSTDTDVPLLITVATDLLGNDSDIDGDTPALSTFDVASTQGGTIIDNGNGTLTYTPPSAFTGLDTFTYTVIDGNGGSAIGTVEVAVSLIPKTLQLFILTGQSNSLGTLATSDVTMNRAAPGNHPVEQGMAVPFFWNNTTNGTPAGTAELGDSGGWVDLAPQLGGAYANNDDHWGPEIGFARMLWNAGYRDFGIVKASRGGGGNDFWVKNSPDDHMYDLVLATANAAVGTLPPGFTSHEFAGLLYLQGESNNATEANEADTRFDALLTNLKADLSISGTLAGVFGEIGGGASTNRDLTRTKQLTLANSRSDIGYASSAGTNQHDGLHYKADSQLLIGERMASEMIGTGALGAEPLPAWPDLYAWYISDNGAQPNTGNTIERWASLNNGTAARDLTRTVSGRPATLPVTSGSGQPRQIMSFDGTSDLWASTGEFGTLADTRSIAIMCRLTTSDNGYLFDGATSTGRTRAQIRDGDWQSGVSTTGWDVADPVTTALTTSVWQQHVFTFDDNGADTDLTHWIDGVQVATPTDTLEVSDLRGFIIASNGGSTFRPLHVEIAEVAVYDTVLDGTEIASLQGSWNSRWGTPTGPPFGVGVDQSPRSIPRFGSSELLLVTIDNPNAGTSTLDDLTVTLAPGTRDLITSISLVNGGSSPSFDPIDPALDTVASPGSDTINLTASLSLPEGRSYLWIAIEPERWAPLGSTIDGQVDDITFSGAEAGTIVPSDGNPTGVLTFDSVPMFVDIRTRGAHGLGANYRIPGIAADGNGVLHAVYDNRYGFGNDLPGDVDVAYNRSTDGGVTWEPQQIIMDADSGVSGSSGNGVGDPCILWDPATDTLWCAALWSFGNNAYSGSGPGLSPNTPGMDTGQYVLTKSTDGGDTWSPPINITTNNTIDPGWHLLWDPAWSDPIPPASGLVKENPNWNLLYQGPGHGLVMRNGTLVFPSQYRDGTSTAGPPGPYNDDDGINQVRSCSIFSTDNGSTWQFGSSVPSTSPQTNENTVCELDDGRLLWTCRTPSGGGGLRAWAHYTPGGASPMRDGTWGTTELGIVNDLYQLAAVPDPVVQGSVIQWKSTFDGHPREWILFANPATGGRNGMTLRISADGGITWPVSRLVYAGPSAYSSLCILPDNSIGLLFEKDGTSKITFVRIEEDWLLNPDIDTDGDSLPDAWEQLYGTDPNVVDDQEDPDGDGSTNTEERAAGTDPLNPASVLKLTSLTGTPTTLDPVWSSVPGKTYILETSEDLLTWTPTGTPFTATGPSSTVQIPHANPPKLFVRVGTFQ